MKFNKSIEDFVAENYKDNPAMQEILMEEKEKNEKRVRPVIVRVVKERMKQEIGKTTFTDSQGNEQEAPVIKEQ